MILVKETLPVGVDVLGTLFPFADRRSGRKKREQVSPLAPWKTRVEDLRAGGPGLCVLPQVEDSEGSRGGQVVEAAWTPPALKGLLVPGDAVGEMRLVGGWKTAGGGQRKERKNQRSRIALGRLAGNTSHGITTFHRTLNRINGRKTHCV